MSLLQDIFFKNTKITTFGITRLKEEQVKEKVFFQKGRYSTEITHHQGMICLDPFCMAVWLSNDELNGLDPQSASIKFMSCDDLNALIHVSLIERKETPLGALLLYSIGNVKNYQLTALHRLALFGRFLKSPKNTFRHRKVISALYSYPRRIIIVSYKDDDYYNIFPMDIQSYIADEKLYLLGLRTTNVALDKILDAKKVVVCDTDNVEIATVYKLGKHPSANPTQIGDMPFKVTESEKFGFFVPDFSGSYKELEIIDHKKMGYHMLMIGKVVNEKQLKPKSESLYHVGFLQFQKSAYPNIEGLY